MCQCKPQNPSSTLKRSTDSVKEAAGRRWFPCFKTENFSLEEEPREDCLKGQKIRKPMLQKILPLWLGNTVRNLLLVVVVSGRNKSSVRFLR